MIYACDSHHVYLTNPLETKSIETIMKELTSESVLLVRSNDIIKRFNANNTSLIDLIHLDEEDSLDERRRWHDMNVLGQVLTVLREAKLGSGGGTSDLKVIHQLDESSGQQVDGAVMSNTNSDDIAATQMSLALSSNMENSGQQSTTSNQQSTTYVSIPASYKSGICLFAYKDSELYGEIMAADELPLGQKL